MLANLTKLRNNRFLLATGLFLLLLITFYCDQSLLRRSLNFRISWLDSFMLFITDFGLLGFAVLLLASLYLKSKWRVMALLLFSLALSFEITYLLKLIFQTPRPYFTIEFATIPLTQASGFSFPSLHAACCLGFFPFLKQIFRKHWPILISQIFLISVAFSRSYLGVHYFSDIFAGGMIGYFTSSILMNLQEKHQAIDWFMEHIKSKFELRRQIAHLIIGGILVFLIELNLITVNILLLTLVLGGLLSLITKYRPIPLLHELLVKFERPEDLRYFPGKGPFFMILGTLLCLIFFPIEIAKAAIIILAIGDSISHIVGRYSGKTPVPFAPNKKLEGTIVAIILSTFGALLFVNIEKAFVASLIVISLEAIYPAKIARFFDDNLMVPLAAGLIMLFI
ncbi:phosphatase PAP2 family protein [Candidatus Peregrinibacteria bacterium]|nr:phosphatase PAP2 family protein [Candidatus Peregrinibacteria bacterium]